MILKTTKNIMSFLIEKDSAFNKLYEMFGYIEYKNNIDIFQSIVSHIVGQMLSNKVSTIIYNRLDEKIGGVCVENIIKAEDSLMRDCGISYSKIKYIKQFAIEYQSGRYDFSKLNYFSDGEVISYLKRINGVGQWTAEMIALFTLGREDVFSYDDVALKLGIMEVHKEFKTLSKKRFNRLQKLYSPYSSYAAMYYYAFHDSKFK